MPRVEKGVPNPFHTPLKQRNGHPPSRGAQGLWIETIENACKSSHGTQPRPSQRDIRPLEPNGTHTATLALKILFPGHLIEELSKLKNMPENTLEEKIAKENAFRNIILQQYHIREVIADKNCGLRAIINSLHPELDPTSEEITATILRGDIILHLMNNPDTFKKHNDERDFTDPEALEVALYDYRSKMVNSEVPIGNLEIKTLSEILETPIQVISYQKPHNILADEEGAFGLQHQSAPISLYFDPIRNQYHPMKKLPH